MAFDNSVRGAGFLPQEILFFSDIWFGKASCWMNERTRVGILLAVTILVYGNTLLNGFTYDDDGYILSNQTVKAASVAALFHPTINNVLRPITFGTFVLNWALAGQRPFPYHLVNVLLESAVVLLLYLLLQMLLESVPYAANGAFAAALLFAVHPIHTEAVASIVGRSELLAAGFLLAAWILHLRDRPFAALACLVLALMSKESAVVLLPLVLAGDFARGKLKPPLRYASLAAVTVLYLAWFWKAKGGRFGEESIVFLDNPLISLSFGLRRLNALRIAWKYVGLHVYPATLSYDYSYNAILLRTDWRHLLPAGAAALLVLVLWIWTLRSRRHPWFLAGAIYLLGFAVTANLFVPTGTIMGERLAYLPSAGFCLLVSLIWVQVEKRKPQLAWGVLVVLLFGLAARTMVRNRDWRDNLALYSAGVRACPGSARAHKNLADTYMNLGHLGAARTEFQVALRIYPDYPSALNNYGAVEFQLGNDRDAREALRKALSMTDKTSSDYMFVEVNLAKVLIRLGQDDDALSILNRDIAERGGYAPAWSNRAAIRFRRGEAAAARSDAEMALRLDPSNTQATKILGALNAAPAPSSSR